VNVFKFETTFPTELQHLIFVIKMSIPRSNLVGYLRSVQQDITRRGQQQNHKNLVTEIKSILAILEGTAQDQQRQSEALRTSIDLVAEGIRIYEQQLRNETLAAELTPPRISHAEFCRLVREDRQSKMGEDSAQMPPKFLGG